jgi:hypothetical protein
MMRNLNLHHNVEPLGSESAGHLIVPSDNIYYNHYPYKVLISTPYKDRSSFELEVYECARTSDFESEYRLQWKRDCSDKARVYLKSFDDYKKFITVYSTWIVSVTGPTSSTHLNDLISSEYRIEARKRNWYNHYDAKVYMYLHYRHARGYTQKEREAMHMQIRQDLLENIEPDSIKLPVGPRSSSYSTEFYTRLADFNKYLPFWKMMYSHWNIRITKAVLY